MFESQELRQQILQAINASEKIIASLQRGDLEQAEECNDKRAECVRALSKCRNFETLAIPCMAEIERLAELDKIILQDSHKLRDEILTEIRHEQTNRFGHVQYTQNQLL